ncbi:SIR2 family NAD-dependent protein deacylase [Labilibaculum antarcticum]|uniref:protein acetyllysine N-acetyltransferase n=1 Tax=Labilibaculum antarcticum TaxID=1717717 RepID=A0A1Y1CS22_9BACT|nr:NAD-dependent deacylase [Labilibaculum antarcticum]BAX82041.1 sigma factor [Labilibaculum antarcticum]
MKVYIQKAAELIRNSKAMIAFTGAGVSVESGIPPFRGTNGLWSRYDPQCLDLDFFHSHPKESWTAIKTIFYDFFGNAKFNEAHRVLADFEAKGILKTLVTQNIDNLHQMAGSKNVLEFHGNSQKLICPQCKKMYVPEEINLDVLPPLCVNDGFILKPDFVFFGEGIPEEAYRRSILAARKADVVLIIGTTGEVMPASMIPSEAKRAGATIIEINTEPSNYTNRITDIFLEGKASEILLELEGLIYPEK